MRYDAKISPIAARCIVELRGDPGAAQRVARQLGLTLPRRPNTYLRNDAETEIAWLGPRRWIVMAAQAREAEIGGALERHAAAEPLLAAASISDMLAGFEVSGRDAREILGQGTPLDLAPGAFPDDMASGTDFFGAPAIVRRRDSAENLFELWIDRSLARFARDWLAAASGGPIPNSS